MTHMQFNCILDIPRTNKRTTLPTDDITPVYLKTIAIFPDSFVFSFVVIRFNLKQQLKLNLIEKETEFAKQRGK